MNERKEDTLVVFKYEDNNLNVLFFNVIMPVLLLPSCLYQVFDHVAVIQSDSQLFTTFFIQQPLVVIIRLEHKK